MTQAGTINALLRLKKARQSERTKTVAFAGALSAFTLLSVLLACFPGAVELSYSDVLAALGNMLGLKITPENPTALLIVTGLRLPRILLSFLTGAALAVSGGVFQGILRNPLADPFTIGVSTGAAFGATLAIFFGLAASQTAFLGLSMGLLPLAALAGALGALFLVIALARAGGTIRRETLVLAGIVTATFLSALISLLKSLDEDSVSSIVFWIMGSFQGRGWESVGIFLPYFVAGIAVIWFFSRELDLLAMGETQARQLGLNASASRTRLLVGASLLAGAAVSVSGVIGFVGLIVPHLVRLLLGAEHRRLLLISGLLGGIVLLWADVLARSILPDGVELPVGVVTALLGGPFFCLLLMRKSRMGG